jgi:replicative DNA helicase
MPDLDLAFTSYLLTERPPLSLLRGSTRDLHLQDPRAEALVGVLCSLPDSVMEIPEAITMSSLCRERHLTDLADYVRESSEATPVASDLQGHLLLLRDRYTITQQETMLQNMQRSIASGDKLGALRLAQELTTLTQASGHQLVKPTDFEYFLEIDDMVQVEPMAQTHLPELNQKLGGQATGYESRSSGGLPYGGVTVIAGYTNAGKSTLAQSMWNHHMTMCVDNPNYRSVYINYEERRKLFKQHLFSMITGTFPTPDKQGRHFYEQAVQEYLRFMQARKGGFLIYDNTLPYDLRSLEEELTKVAQLGYRIAYIDTINSVDEGNAKDTRMTLVSAMKMLERVSKSNDMAIVITAQNKQALQFEEDKWPELKWIGESAALQQKVDTALGIYRADLYSDGSVDYTACALMKLRHRSVQGLKEFAKMGYDKYRRMYIPYEDGSTSAVLASENTQTNQVLTTMQGDPEGFLFGGM